MKLLTKALFLLIMLSISSIPEGSAQQFRALLFTKTAGFHHSSIHEGVAAVKELADRHFFRVDWHEDPSLFSDRGLDRYDVIIFLNTTGDILNDDQQAAMERFIQSGKGFVGIHSASDTEYDWEWYTKMVGMMFHIHPKIQTAVLKVENKNFPGMEVMPEKRIWTDEWYEFGSLLSEDLTYLVTVDEETYDPEVKWGSVEGKGMGDFHPVSWYHDYDGGRAFYTALGHVSSTFDDPVFRDHLYGAMYWAATGKGID